MSIRKSRVLVATLVLFAGFMVLSIAMSASSGEETLALQDDAKIKLLEKQLADANKQIKILEGEKKKLTDALGKQADQTKNLQKQLDAANKQLATLANEKKQLADALSKETAKAQQLEKQLTDAVKQNKALADKLAAAGKGDAEKIKALEKVLQAQQVKNKELQIEADKANQVAADRLKELAIKEKQLQKQITVNTDLVAAHQKEIKSLTADRDLLAKLRTADIEQIKKLSANLTAEQKRNAQLVDNATKLEQSLAESEKTVAAQKSAIAKLTDNNKNLQATLAQTNKALEEAREKADFAIAAWTIEKKRADELDARVKNLECELASRLRIFNLIRTTAPRLFAPPPGICCPR